MKSPAILNLASVTHVLAAAFLSCLAASSHGAAILWNQLGSADQVLHSAYGPNLGFYSGGSFVDMPANPEFVPGVFGNALTIGAGNYYSAAREHNVVWNNVNQYLSADHGTIAMWYKQNVDPLAWSYGVYRLFDGDYGLGTGIGILAEDYSTPMLDFDLSFGGADCRIGYNISAFNGTWIHVAAVWDRGGIAGSADTMRLYVNGNIVAAGSANGWGSVIGQQADIGGGNDAGIAGKFAIDNLQVFDSAMTDFSGRFVEAIPEPAVGSLLAFAALGLLLRNRR